MSRLGLVDMVSKVSEDGFNVLIDRVIPNTSLDGIDSSVLLLVLDNTEYCKHVWASSQFSYRYSSCAGVKVWVGRNNCDFVFSNIILHKDALRSCNQISSSRQHCTLSRNLVKSRTGVSSNMERLISKRFTVDRPRAGF